MSGTFRFLRLTEAILIIAASLCNGAAWADPPGRIGRLSAVDGTVSLYDVDSGDWQPVAVNWPITGGDTLWTGPGDRANVRIGSTVVRLDGSTELQFKRLDDAGVEVRLIGGSVAVRLDDPLMAAQFHLETEHGRTSLIETGRYRFDFGDFTTSATVYRGQLAFEGNGQGYVVAAGQRGEFWYTGSLEMRVADVRRDFFFDWIAASDRREDRWRTPRYVSAYMTGYEDLDLYGDWQDSDEFGTVWIPRRLPSGWSPYRNGHWALIAPWGWTWIDDAPWGFAPFHYGRWALWHGAWCWVPGSYDPAPAYAPALVAWIGQPGGGPLQFNGSPAVGWFPLAPRETYVPPYRVGDRALQSINRDQTEVPHVVPRYRYREVPQAVTVVPLKVLTGGHPVNRAYDNRMDLHGLAEAPVSRDAPAHWQAPPRARPQANGDVVLRQPQPLPARPDRAMPKPPGDSDRPPQAVKQIPHPPQKPPAPPQVKPTAHAEPPHRHDAEHTPSANGRPKDEPADRKRRE